MVMRLIIGSRANAAQQRPEERERLRCATIDTRGRQLARKSAECPCRQLGCTLKRRTKAPVSFYRLSAICQPGVESWLRGRDLNPRPLGYEPNELPDCSTPRHREKYQC